VKIFEAEQSSVLQLHAVEKALGIWSYRASLNRNVHFLRAVPLTASANTCKCMEKCGTCEGAVGGGVGTREDMADLFPSVFVKLCLCY